MDEKQHQHDVTTIITNRLMELHNSCSYIIAIELHKLHMYTIPHMVNCVCYNSFNLTNNTHVLKIELQ
jgi:hypothetical protein